MKVGASQYHPGLTVRWRGKGEWLLLWCARDRRALAIVAGDAPSRYAALIRAGRSVSLVDEPHTRRCDAKRAAEVLVGQWWREKCEREAKAKRYAFAMRGGVSAAFNRMAEAAREAAERFSVLTAKGSDLDRLAEVYGVEARSGE